MGVVQREHLQIYVHNSVANGACTALITITAMSPLPIPCSPASHVFPRLHPRDTHPPNPVAPLVSLLPSNMERSLFLSLSLHTHIHIRISLISGTIRREILSRDLVTMVSRDPHNPRFIPSTGGCSWDTQRHNKCTEESRDPSNRYTEHRQLAIRMERQHQGCRTLSYYMRQGITDLLCYGNRYIHEFEGGIWHGQKIIVVVRVAPITQ